MPPFIIPGNGLGLDGLSLTVIPNAPVKVDLQGVGLKLGSGLTVNPNGELESTAGGTPNAPLAIDGDGNLALNTSTDFTVENQELTLQTPIAPLSKSVAGALLLQSGASLVISADGSLSLKSPLAPLKIGDDGAMTLQLGDGLEVVGGKLASKVAVVELPLTVTGNILGLKIGSTLEVDRTNLLQIRSPISPLNIIGAGNLELTLSEGLEQDDTGLTIKLGQGLKFDSDGVSVATGDGLTMVDKKVTLNLSVSTGLSFNNGVLGLNLTAGNGLQWVDTNNLNLKIGSGLEFSGDGNLQTSIFHGSVFAQEKSSFSTWVFFYAATSQALLLSTGGQIIRKGQSTFEFTMTGPITTYLAKITQFTFTVSSINLNQTDMTLHSGYTEYVPSTALLRINLINSSALPLLSNPLNRICGFCTSAPFNP